MKVALIDNGSLEPAAHKSLRKAAAAIGALAGIPVEAVSWKHSGRIAPAELGGQPAWTLAAWIRSQFTGGEREFVLIPFFISAQGAIGSLLRRDLEALRESVGEFEYSFSSGLADSPALAEIVASRVRDAAAGLDRPCVVVVDHGGPAPVSAAVRNRIADEVRSILGTEIGTLRAASMESPDGPDFEFNRPLLTDALALSGPGDVVIAPLFLSPGRHAGPDGDLARIARQAEERSPLLRCRFAELIGSHRLASEFLAGALQDALRAGVRT